jgi:hypothetical protein
VLTPNQDLDNRIDDNREVKLRSDLGPRECRSGYVREAKFCSDQEIEHIYRKSAHKLRDLNQ